MSLPNISEDSVPKNPPMPEQRSYLSMITNRFRRHRLAVFGFFTVIIIITAVIFGPFLSPYDPNRIDFKVKNQPPSLTHPMGTDELGRDQLTRILHGGRLTLTVAVFCVIVSVSVGIAVGSFAGYRGGWLDNILMRGVDIFYSLPSLFVVIILMTLIGPGFWTIVISISILRWMTTSRLVRGCYLSLKEREFTFAARALGLSNIGIMIRHLLPNSIGPIIVSATLGIAVAIRIESTLSFLGLGFQPPNATWGRMLQEAQKSVIQFGHWWRAFFPGIMIFITILSVNFIGDGLRDALDPTGLTGRKDKA
jgi:peptide/nickel transport system permease protein